MILSTEIHSMSRCFGEENAIGMLADIGFDALDYSMYTYQPASPVFSEDFAVYAQKLRTLAAQKGVFFNQAHAPYDFSGDEADLPAHTAHLQRAISFAGLLGAEAVIVHPIGHGQGMAQKAYNRAFYQELIPTAREYGIRIAIENMFLWNTETYAFEASVCGNAAEHADYVDSFDPEQIVACLDVGHCRLAGCDPVQTIRTLGGKRLQALHVHDNDLSDDLHMLPYLGTTNWTAYMRALTEIGYSGALTFETHHFVERFPDAMVEEALRFLEKMGRYLMGLR